MKIIPRKNPPLEQYCKKLKDDKNIDIYVNGKIFYIKDDTSMFIFITFRCFSCQFYLHVSKVPKYRGDFCILSTSPFQHSNFSLFVQISGKIRDFSVREDDIWISTFPKCGTTWTQVILLQIHKMTKTPTYINYSCRMRGSLYKN